MEPDFPSPTRAILPGILGVIVAIALIACAAFADQFEQREHDERQRHHLESAVAGVHSRLEASLNERFQLVRGLEALVRMKPAISQAEFEGFARDMGRRDPAIRALQLARAGVVSHIYPLEGNQRALGHELLVDPRVAEGARRAIETGRMHVVGPYPLLQGRDGLIARLPVFLDAESRSGFWGFAIVVLDFRAILEESAINPSTDVRFALRGRDGRGAAGDVFHGDASVFHPRSRVATEEVHLPGGGHWLIAAAPALGVDEGWPGRPWLLAGTLLLLLPIPAAVAVLRRMSELGQARERSRLAERLLASLGEGVYGIDAAGCCTFINPAALAMLGWRRDDLVGREIGHLLHDPGTLDEAQHRNDYECTLRRHDGSTFPARFSFTPFANGQGGVVAFNDVSQQRTDAERLRLAASIFAHTQQGIMVTDAQGLLVDVNPAFSEITGYGRDEVLGRNPRILSSGRQSSEFYAEMNRTLAETGSWRGEIWNRHKSGQVYPELLCIAAVSDESGERAHHIGIFSDISRQKQHEFELLRIAHYDPLTGLPNRVLLTDRISQGIGSARRSHGRLAVGVVDLDRFKEINDRLGHDVGDQVLMEVANRLKALTSSSDTLARPGGDEFVLLVPSLTSVAACEAQAYRLLEALRAPIAVGEHLLEISASVGFTIFPEDNADADMLLRHAGQAMYLAKEHGGGRYRIFDSEQDRAARSQREILDAVACAIRNDELRLHYQPKVAMRGGRIVGFEALVRWQHPEKGLLSPASFLPAVEGTDLDPELGRWVLRNAMNQLSAWRAQGLRFSVSVNISAMHLLRPDFLSELDELFARHPLVTPDALEIEVLESTALDDIEAATATLQACIDRGISVALDDFGTGYSSLAYFKHLPIRTLKVAQIFVRDMLDNSEDQVMMEGIVSFARAFKRDIVAEGVDTPALSRALLEMGCDIVQGYAISPPMTAHEVPEWARSFQPLPEWAAPLLKLTA